MVRQARRLIAAALLAFGFTAFGVSAGGAQAERLAIGVAQAPVDLHPLYDAHLIKRYLFGMSLRGLTVYDEDWTLAPLIATRVPSFENGDAERWTSDEGEAGVALTLEIRDDAFWADGQPVVTDDFVLSRDIGRDRTAGVPNFEFYDRLKKIEPIDDRRFRLFFDRLTYRYNALGDFTPTPAHLERAIFEADPARYRSETLYRRAPETPGLWNGPYRLAEARIGAQYAYAPNPHWAGPAPGFETIEVRVIENTAALEANLLSGAVDMIAGEVGLSVDQAVALERRAGDRFAFHYEPSLFYEHLTLNHAHPALADATVRRALSLAIDRAALTEQIFAGRATPAGGFMAPLDPMAAEMSIGYDPDYAGELLDEAGWRPGAGGLRRNASGEPLTVQIVTTAGARARAVVQQAIQAWWRAIGVDAQIDAQPPRVLFGDTLRKREFPAAAMFAWISAPEHLPKTTLHSTHIPTEANGWGGQNYAGFVDDETDRLIDAIEIELDASVRQGLWAELQGRYRDLSPAIPLYFRNYAFVSPLWLEGLAPRGHLDLSTFGVEHWRRKN